MRINFFEATKQTACIFSKGEETGVNYYGARYLDPKYSRWLSGDPALSDYIPKAPIDDEAKKHNENLPGMGGVYNIVNMHLYHYAGNNPVKYTDPDGRTSINEEALDVIQVGDTNSTNQTINTTIQPQTPTDPNDYHCDILAWNAALDNGQDPRSQTGTNWNGNELTVAEIYALYPDDRTQAPQDNTAGYSFYFEQDSDEPVHMEYYIYNTGENYTLYRTNGINDPVQQERNIDNIANRVFVPLPSLE